MKSFVTRTGYENAYLLDVLGGVKRLWIPAEGEQGRLKALQEAVGGYIEPVNTTVGTIYVNEEGMINQLPINVTLTLLINATQYYRGRAIIIADKELHHRLKLDLETLVEDADAMPYTFFSEGEE